MKTCVGRTGWKYCGWAGAGAEAGVCISTGAAMGWVGWGTMVGWTGVKGWRGSAALCWAWGAGRWDSALWVCTGAAGATACWPRARLRRSRSCCMATCMDKTREGGLWLTSVSPWVLKAASSQDCYVETSYFHTLHSYIISTFPLSSYSDVSPSTSFG